MPPTGEDRRLSSVEMPLQSKVPLLQMSFPLQEGPPCLDLANTLVSDRPGRDLLMTEVQLADWLHIRGIALDGRARHPTVLAELRGLRAVVRELVVATIDEEALRPEAVSTLNATAVRAATAPQLIVGAGGPTQIEHAEGTPVDRLLGDLARSAVELLAGPRRDRLRACAGPACRLLFLAAHPGRTWCDSRTCGNRVRVARHRARTP